MAASRSSTMECPICIAECSPLKKLSCNHKFCQRCLEQIGQPIHEDELQVSITCPTCRDVKKYHSVEDLPNHFIGRIECDRCNKVKETEDVWWCLSCVQIICSSCHIKEHMAQKGHKVQSWDEAQPARDCAWLSLMCTTLETEQTKPSQWNESNRDELQKFLAEVEEHIKQRDLLETAGGKEEEASMMIHEALTKYFGKLQPDQQPSMGSIRQNQNIERVNKMTRKLLKIAKKKVPENLKECAGLGQLEEVAVLTFEKTPAEVADFILETIKIEVDKKPRPFIKGQSQSEKSSQDRVMDRYFRFRETNEFVKERVPDSFVQMISYEAFIEPTFIGINLTDRNFEKNFDKTFLDVRSVMQAKDWTAKSSKVTIGRPRSLKYSGTSSQTNAFLHLAEKTTSINRLIFELSSSKSFAAPLTRKYDLKHVSHLDIQVLTNLTESDALDAFIFLLKIISFAPGLISFEIYHFNTSDPQENTLSKHFDALWSHLPSTCRSFLGSHLIQMSKESIASFVSAFHPYGSISITVNRKCWPSYKELLERLTSKSPVKLHRVFLRLLGTGTPPILEEIAQILTRHSKGNNSSQGAEVSLVLTGFQLGKDHITALQPYLKQFSSVGVCQMLRLQPEADLEKLRRECSHKCQFIRLSSRFDASQ